jgi:methanogenic corrinoid protein MtbC1
MDAALVTRYGPPEDSPGPINTSRSAIMNIDKDVDILLETCLRGDRDEVRSLVDQFTRESATPDRILLDVVIPAIEKIVQIERADQADIVAVNVMMRSMRLVVNRLTEKLSGPGIVGPTRRILLGCGASMTEEFQAEIVARLLEIDGHDVRFAGSGIPADELLAEIGSFRPDLLLLYAASASDAPDIRSAIDRVQEIGSCPDLQIVVAGGVFGRTPGLAEEIGADLWAETPDDLRIAIVEEATRRAIPEQRTVGRARRISKAA